MIICSVVMVSYQVPSMAWSEITRVWELNPGSISGDSFGSNTAANQASNTINNGAERVSEKSSLEKPLTNSADEAERHIYDEVPADDDRSREFYSSERGKDLLAGQKVTAVISKQSLKSISRSLDADAVTGSGDNERTPTLQVKKKEGKLRKQKSFTKKWLSNKSNLVVHSSSPSSSEGPSYFGQPLENLMLFDQTSGHYSIPPLFVTQCIQYIEQMGKYCFTPIHKHSCFWTIKGEQLTSPITISGSPIIAPPPPA